MPRNTCTKQTIACSINVTLSQYTYKIMSKKTGGNSSDLAHRLVGFGIDPLQVLTDADFDLHTEELKLTAQVKIAQKVFDEKLLRLSYEHEKIKFGQRQKELINSRWAAIKTVNDCLKKLVLNQPPAVMKAVLIWLGHKHVKQIGGASHLNSDWVVLSAQNGKLMVFSHEPHLDLESINSRLLECLDDMPAATIEAIQFALRFHEITFTKAAQYSSPERLERFLQKNLPGWGDITGCLDLNTVIAYTNLTHLPEKNASQAFSIIIKTLEYRDRAAPYQLKKLDALLESWQKIISADANFLAGFENRNTLFAAAKKACNTDSITSKLKVSEAIDKATNFKYSDLAARSIIHRKINQLYTSRVDPLKDSSNPIVYTLTIDEIEALEYICCQYGLNKTQAVSLCVESAYKVSKKPKKQLEEYANQLLYRSETKRTSVRVYPDTTQKLNEVTLKLNKLKATQNRTISKSAAAGWAIKLYAASSDVHHQTKPPLSGSSVKRKRELGQDLRDNDNWTQLAQQRDKTEH